MTAAEPRTQRICRQRLPLWDGSPPTAPAACPDTRSHEPDRHQGLTGNMEKTHEQPKMRTSVPSLANQPADIKIAEKEDADPPLHCKEVLTVEMLEETSKINFLT
ncbi:uncharacterized protein LOC144193135 [Stigmatopora nigra]